MSQFPINISCLITCLINIDLDRHFAFADNQRFRADYHDNECTYRCDYTFILFIKCYQFSNDNNHF